MLCSNVRHLLLRRRLLHDTLPLFSVYSYLLYISTLPMVRGHSFDQLQCMESIRRRGSFNWGALLAPARLCDFIYLSPS